ncbi:ABSCISIC ACID-INSENSITIVE 5-like protein 2 [Striga hermonthica]|uniref:ABSCISIC ACID-INSENSITIVE 5-like protein 2 n=1 Tax=Striga hermonthica TaxID=68872 RepID=A0A9N7NWN9_STRHE|nr:ABSCISIC ACID-INSENSITIVE 5-like protein 2 [Striga hermonthica]
MDSINTNQEQEEQQQKQLANEDKTTVIGRQPSIYSLTLDDLQNTLNGSGKNFGSMNMDEFLNSIWTAEEAQTQTQAQSQAQFSSYVQPTSNPAPFLLKQGSLALPEPLFGKTVDEVWSHIHKVNEGSRAVEEPANRQPTLGEMTLEDSLVRAGIVRQQNNNGEAVNCQLSVGPTNVVAGVGPRPRRVERRRQKTDGPAVERRQRRMMKNRESAARSRARKQAYTAELEAELHELREENAHLKEALDECEKKWRRQCEEARVQAQVRTKAQTVNNKLRAMRGSSSCHY